MERIQNKIAWALVAALSLLVIAALAGVVRGGPLDPSASPGSTQQNLIFQPASCDGFPIMISALKSSHKFAQDIVLPPGCAKTGIVVDGAFTTIDLQGFQLVGAFASSINGIETTNSGLTVRNGTIREFTEGIGITAADSLSVHGVRVRHSTDGIVAGDDATLANCDVNANTASGISVGKRSSINGCRVYANSNGGVVAGANSNIRGTVAYQNGVVQIRAGNGSNLENCTAEGFGTQFELGIQVGDDGVIRGCTARNHGGTEILAGARAVLEDCIADGINPSNGLATPGDGIVVGIQSVVRGCTAVNNGGREILAGGGSTLEDCAASGMGSAGNGIEVGIDSVVSNCTANGNGGVEILAGTGSTLENCIADGGTAGNGIEVGDDSIIRGCVAKKNGGHEIVAGNQVLIEDCVAEGWSGVDRSPGDGIQIGTKSIVRECIVTNNAGNGIITLGTHNRLENNEAVDNTGWGIYLFNGGAGNIVIGNRSQANGGNCFDPGGNAFIQVTGATFGSATHPWINFC